MGTDGQHVLRQLSLPAATVGRPSGSIHFLLLLLQLLLFGKFCFDQPKSQTDSSAVAIYIYIKDKTCVINDPLGQTHSPISIFRRRLYLFCDILKIVNVRTDGRKNGNMWENNDHYRPGLWVGWVDQKKEESSLVATSFNNSDKYEVKKEKNSLCEPSFVKVPSLKIIALKHARKTSEDMQS